MEGIDSQTLSTKTIRLEDGADTVIDLNGFLHDKGTEMACLVCFIFRFNFFQLLKNKEIQRTGTEANSE